MKLKTIPPPSKIPEWINDPPAQEEIETIRDSNDVPIAEFLPIGIVEPKLTKLDAHWGTENFKFQVMEILGVPFTSSSLELVITYGDKTRRLVGAATQPVQEGTNFLDPTVNSNFAATLKSECIKNAAKGIGIAFGSALNGRDTISTPTGKSPVKGKLKSPAVKMKADDSIRKTYAKAVVEQDKETVNKLELAYEF